MRSFSASIRSQRINTLTFGASLRSQPAYQYAHSVSIRSSSALATLASWLRYHRHGDAGVAGTLTQRLQMPTAQRLQTLTASADVHSVSARPQRIITPTARNIHPFHSVSMRPQRINTPTAYCTLYAHSVSVRPQCYGDASVMATPWASTGIKGGAPDIETIPCLTFVGDACLSVS